MRGTLWNMRLPLVAAADRDLRYNFARRTRIVGDQDQARLPGRLVSWAGRFAAAYQKERTAFPGIIQAPFDPAFACLPDALPVRNPVIRGIAPTAESHRSPHWPHDLDVACSLYVCDC
ncbi:MAG: hypothetical protein AB1646_05445 [Thermodesulfobacteriota bacterium]